MNKKVKSIIVFLVIMVFLSSCGQAITNSQQPEKVEGQQEPVADLDSKAGKEEDNQPVDPIEESKDDGQSTVDLKAMKVNELGKIMVLMYHEIGLEEGVWVRTPENFRKDLQTLYEKGYRAISLKDYLSGNINTPPGTTPVVITFDDSTKGQFNVLEEQGDFIVDPDCAVGILEEFYRQHPDFGLEATFYIFYPNPFRQKSIMEQKIKYIVDKGMDIGNHSYTHDNLKKDMKTKAPRDEMFIQESLGKNVQRTREILPGYEVDSLALPYGEKPVGDLYQYVVKGIYQDVQYHHKGVLLVGSNPARPPYHIKADMANIPRIRASEMETYNTGLYDWLEYFDKHPEEKFISDGDGETVSFPKDLEELVDVNRLDGKIIKAYD